MPGKRVYELRLRFNGRWFNRVVISDHFEERHQATMNDALVLELVRSLDGTRLHMEREATDGYRYFVNDRLFYQGKPYRIVLTFHPLEDYLGVG